MRFVLVFLGGGVGAVLRYSVGLLVGRLTPTGLDTPHWLSMYPVATLSVNLIGCGLIGLAWGLMGKPETGGEPLRLALIVGVLGGFTTFSSFGWETLDLLGEGRAATALLYVVLSVCVGLLLAYSGHGLGEALR